jgi:hypothetical protein
VVTTHHQRDDGSVAERWDTWTRDEILAIRGYAASPASAAPIGCSGLTTDDSEATNGAGPPNGKPSAVTPLVATDGTAASPIGPAALTTPEALPKAINGPVGLRTAARACSECGGPLPVQSRPERVVCSPRCRQRRHDRLRKSSETSDGFTGGGYGWWPEGATHAGTSRATGRAGDRRA